MILNPVGIAGKTRSDFDKMLAKRRAKQGRRRASRPDARRRARDRRRARLAELETAVATRTIGEVVLRTEEVSVTYGGLRAVDRVTIEVRAGEIVGLIGPNGAGKTSFIDAITGFTPSSGEVFLARRTDVGHGRPTPGPARASCARGSRSSCSRTSRPRTTSASATTSATTRWKMLTDSVRPNPPPSAAVRNAIELMGLEDVADRKPSELPLGRQKTLGVARSLALGPKVLLLDEPAAGLDMTESVAFGEHLRHIAATGVGCLLVDHDMHLVLGVCDRIYVIEFGTPDRQRPAGRGASRIRRSWPPTSAPSTSGPETVGAPS